MQRSTSENETVPGLADDLTGHTLGGRFELLSRRFHSSARSQYSAKTPQGLNVVVTVFPAEVGRSTDDGRAFAAQVRAIKELNHAGIPNLIEAGSTDDGRRFIVHAAVEGRSLRDVIKGEAPLGPERVSQILMKAARVLAVARSSGIMHGNLKPENLLLVVTPTDLEGVVIHDLGVARLVHQRPGAKAGVAGTPRYMSPEQVAGVTDEPKTDIYALGVIAFEMLTAKVPFSSEDADSLFRSHQESPPPPLKGADPHNTASGMFEKLIFKMLAKKPDARPSASDLQEEVNILPEYLETPATAHDDKITDPDSPLPNLAPAAPGGMPSISLDQGTVPPGRGPLEVGAISFESDRPSNPGMRAVSQGSGVPWMAGGAIAMVVLLLGTLWAFSLSPAAADKPVEAAAPPAPAPVAAPEVNGVEVDLEGMKLTRHKAATPVRPAATAPVAVDKEEKSRLVTVTVFSEPSGAQVFEGPVQRGTTPATLLLPRGTARTLVVKLEGYQDETRSLTPSDNAELTVALKKQDTPPAVAKTEEKPVVVKEDKPAEVEKPVEKTPPPVVEEKPVPVVEAKPVPVKEEKPAEAEKPVEKAPPPAAVEEKPAEPAAQ